MALLIILLVLVIVLQIVTLRRQSLSHRFIIDGLNKIIRAMSK
jgi:hypothetical protein